MIAIDDKPCVLSLDDIIKRRWLSSDFIQPPKVRLLPEEDRARLLSMVTVPVSIELQDIYHAQRELLVRIDETSGHEPLRRFCQSLTRVSSSQWDVLARFYDQLFGSHKSDLIDVLRTHAILGQIER